MSSSHADVTEYFNGSTIARDFFDLLAGEPLASGWACTVYACTIRPDLVVKVETLSHSFQNAAEWMFWNDWKDDKTVARWLAPCESISKCGTVLLQMQTTPPTKRQYPKKMPGFLTDMKRKNFGMLKGRLVCHDYGITKTTLQMSPRKVDWWGDMP